MNSDAALLRMPRPELALVNGNSHTLRRELVVSGKPEGSDERLVLTDKPPTRRLESPPMTSARTQCPDCNGSDVVELRETLLSLRADCFRCRGCGCWWFTPRGADEPATRISSGNPWAEPPD